MVKEINIVIPRLDEIPMDNLIKYLKVANGGDDDLAMTTAFDQLCNIPKENLQLLTYQDAERIYAGIQETLLKRGKLRRSFVMDGVTYAMIPNLERSTVGEYADMDSYITPLFAGEVKHKDALKFMAVLYRPVIDGTVDTVYKLEQYDGTDGRWVKMRKAPSDIYVNSVDFFLELRSDLLQVSQKYLEQELKTMKDNNLVSEKTLVEGGVGLQQLILLQEEMLSIGKAQLDFQLPQLSRSFQWRQNDKKY